MKTYILFWTPDKNWYDLTDISYRIQDGMCGDWSYERSWELSNNIDIKEGDRFFIVCTKTRIPNGNPIYDYLKSSSMCCWGCGPRASKFYNLDGVCFGGFFQSDSYKDEDDDKLKVDLLLEFAVQPGLFPIIHFHKLKKEIPNFDWSHKEGEFLLSVDDEKKFTEIISNWMLTSKMERSDFTNFTERDLKLAHSNLFK